MNRKTLWGICAALMIVLCVAGCGSKKKVVITIVTTSGSGQSATVGTAFGAPLVATVTTNGVAASGVVVTFTAPAQTGASATFAGGANTATTNASGVATSAVVSANDTAGTYTVTATAPGAAAANFSLTNSTGVGTQIACTSGSGQSATVNTAFGAPLVVQVEDVFGNAVNDPGVVVTYVNPLRGAGVTFANGANPATTNASGVATSGTVTANGIAGAYVVNAQATLANQSVACNFSLTNTASTTVLIVTTSGSGQSTAVNTAFGAPLVATVTTGGVPTSGVLVTFTAPAQTGASATFAGGVNTATTDANGVATSAVVSANGTVGTYTVAATAPGAAAAANFTLTNTTATAFTGTYVYSLLGQDFNNGYALVGVVTINSLGTVTGGEQDYSDGDGVTSPQPGGDTITGGTLTVDDAATGQATLILNIPGDTNVGVKGVETLKVQFVNNDHAQIMEFDASATSSGSMDLQTQTTLPTGSFAFSFGGLDPAFNSLVAGGVFTFTGNSTAGTIDINDGGAVTTGVAFSQTFGSPDGSGRGSFTVTSGGSLAPFAFNYYVVGREVIRFLDVDAFGQVSAGSLDVGLGSAYGQGDSVGSFSASSIGQSTIALSGTGIIEPFVLLGQITPGGAAAVKPAVGRMLNTEAPDGVTTNTFAGVVDVDEEGTVLVGNPFTGGGITMATDGRGSLTIPAGDAEDVSNVGVYLIDPHLNPNDPNNPSTTTLGSALLVDLDNSGANVLSTGVLFPQTDTSTASFTGNYALGGQINFFSDFDEDDFVGQGSVTSLALAGSGLFNDPFGDITGAGNDTQTTATFTGTFTSDTTNTNAGRYTADPVVVLGTGQTRNLTVAVYQASGTQLFWIEEEDVTLNKVFMGQLQQQNLPAAAAAAVKAAAAQKKPKQ
jgi:hypothetical protein